MNHQQGKLIKPETLRSDDRAAARQSPASRPGSASGSRSRRWRTSAGSATAGRSTDLPPRFRPCPALEARRHRGRHRRLRQRLHPARRRNGPPAACFARASRLPDLESTKPITRSQAAELAGRYAQGEKFVDLDRTRRQASISARLTARMTVEVRARGDQLVVDDRLAYGECAEDRQGSSDARRRNRSKRRPAQSPPTPPARWSELIGEYGWDHDVLYILEKDGKLHALIEWFFDYPLEEDSTRPLPFS